MAGRDISVTHVALGTVRVMRTTGMMGEVVGMAAAIARKHDTTPWGVYENYLPELKEAMSRGVGKSALAPRGSECRTVLNWRGPTSSTAHRSIARNGTSERTRKAPARKYLKRFRE